MEDCQAGMYVQLDQLHASEQAALDTYLAATSLHQQSLIDAANKAADNHELLRLRCAWCDPPGPCYESHGHQSDRILVGLGHAALILRHACVKCLLLPWRGCSAQSGVLG